MSPPCDANESCERTERSDSGPGDRVDLGPPALSLPIAGRCGPRSGLMSGGSAGVDVADSSIMGFVCG